MKSFSKFACVSLALALAASSCGKDEPNNWTDSLNTSSDAHFKLAFREYATPNSPVTESGKVHALSSDKLWVQRGDTTFGDFALSIEKNEALNAYDKRFQIRLNKWTDHGANSQDFASWEFYYSISFYVPEVKPDKSFSCTSDRSRENQSGCAFELQLKVDKKVNELNDRDTKTVFELDRSRIRCTLNLDSENSEPKLVAHATSPTAEYDWRTDSLSHDTKRKFALYYVCYEQPSQKTILKGSYVQGFGYDRYVGY